VAIVDPPYATGCFEAYGNDTSCNMPGVEVEYMMILMTMMKLPCRLEKRRTAGSMLQAIEDREADMTAYTLALTHELHANYSTTAPIVQDKIVLIVRRHVETIFRSSFFLSAPWTLWAAAVGITISLGTWLLLLSRMPSFQVTRKISWLAFVLWSLIGGVLLETSANFMTVNLVAPSQWSVPLFEDLRELRACVLAGRCRLAGLSAYNNTNNYRSFSDVAGIGLGHVQFLDSRKELAAFVAASEGNVGLDLDSVSSFYTSHFCDQLEIRRFSEFSSLLFVYIASDEALSSRLSLFISATSFRELYGVLVGNYLAINETQGCKSQEKNLHFRPISLEKVYEAFLFLIGGHLAGVATLVYLLLRHRINSRRFSWRRP
jgi:hypothetical protein